MVGGLEQADPSAPIDAKVAGGSLALDGSNPTQVPTGLAHVHGFVATLRGAVSPGLNTHVLTFGAPVNGTVPVYAWKPTSAVDSTLVASTSTETFDWMAIGT